MKNIENYGKIGGILLSLVYLFFFKENEVFQWTVFSLILITIGIPHGALDHLLMSPKITKNGLLKFILKYLGIIGLYLIIWVIAPTLALLFFLGMSAYHFGQSHFMHHPINKWKKTTYFLMGSFFLSVIFWSDFETTAMILANIIDINNFQQLGLPIMLITFLSSNILIFKNLPNSWMLFTLEMAVLGSLLYFLPLLMGFIIYFGFWHALPSITVEYFSLKNYLGKTKIKNFVKRLMPFTAASIGGIWMILAICYNWMNQEELVLLFFILVSLISAPHIWYMNAFLESRKD
jgi:Brp/Blh family beta-carotene 15,15'-monooxygenase